MKRYFVDITKAKTIYLDEITLLNNNLVIKSVNKAGDIILKPVLSTRGFQKSQVGEYALNCNTKNEELLMEVFDYEITNRNISLKDAHVYEEIDKGLYRDATKPVKEEIITLIEFGAIKHPLFKNIPLNQYDIFMLTPNISGDGTLFFDKNKPLIKVTQSIDELRYNLNTTQLGSDLYIKLKAPNLKLLDKLSTYAVDIEIIGNNGCIIKRKNYFLVKPLNNEKLNRLTSEEIKQYKNLITYSIPVKKQRADNHITLNSTDSNDYDDYLWVRRENLEELLSDDIKNSLFKEITNVVTQHEDKFEINNIEDTLDNVKTYLDKNNLPKIEANKGHKIDVYYKHDILSKKPDSIKYGEPFEFVIVGSTDEGYPIYKQIVKLVQNQSNAEYAYGLMLNGTDYFIKISDLPNADEIYQEFKDMGLLYEFIRYEDENYKNNKFVTYYTTQPYDLKKSEDQVKIK